MRRKLRRNDQGSRRVGRGRILDTKQRVFKGKRE